MHYGKYSNGLSLTLEFAEYAWLSKIDILGF